MASARISKPLAAICLLAAALAFAAEPELVWDQGILRRIDQGGLSLVIDGVRFAVAADAKVRIGGRRSAFSLLRPGMKLAYAWRRAPLAARVAGTPKLQILEMEQLPEDAPIERS